MSNQVRQLPPHPSTGVRVGTPDGQDVLRGGTAGGYFYYRPGEVLVNDHDYELAVALDSRQPPNRRTRHRIGTERHA